MRELPHNLRLVPLKGKALLEVLPQEPPSKTIIAPNGYKDRGKSGILKGRVIAISVDKSKNQDYGEDRIYVKDLVWFLGSLEDLGEKYVVVRIERIVARE